MTAEDLRSENRRLDEALLAEAEAFDPERLGVAPDGEWSAAQVLAHLGEFPCFFAGELRRWRDDSSAVTTTGPTGVDASKFLPWSHWVVRHCQSRIEMSLTTV